MSFAAMANVLQATQPRGSRRWVLFLLAYRYNDARGYAWPAIRGRDGLAAQVGLSPRRTIEILRELEAEGWIQTRHRLGKSSQYNISWALLAQHTPPRGGDAKIAPPGQRPAKHARGDDAPRTPGVKPPAPRTTEGPHERQGSLSQEKDPGSDPVEAHVPEWAEPGARATLRWDGQWTEVELYETEDGELAFAHPVLGVPVRAWRWWPALRPLAETTAEPVGESDA